MKAKTANRIWQLSARPARRGFLREAHDPDRVQARYLRKLIASNRDTHFGREHDFARLRAPDDFARAVPIRDRDGYAAYHERIAAGEKRVLTTAPVRFLEETSGSSGFASLVPYTDTLKNEFDRALAVWMRGIYERRPAAFAGPAYWSLSPALKKRRRSPGGLPIGATRDSSYLSPLRALLVGRILAVPENLAVMTDAHAFYLETLAHLIARPDLSLVSVWSPTFFLRLDDFLREHRTELRERAAERSNRERLSRIETVLAGDDFTWQELWPRLALLSCWTDAESAFWIPRVRERLHGHGAEIPIESKGLLATEGVVSIPVDEGDPVLALGCHYYEFRDPGGDNIVPLADLQTGRTYEPLISTGGGLYRYTAGDMVEITGRFRSLPRLRFAGRRNRESDLVGEKLSEYQVTRAIRAALTDEPPGRIAWCFLCPRREPGPPRYELHLEIFAAESNRTHAPSDTQRIAGRLDGALRFNPYYDQARKLGQLGEPAVRFIDARFRRGLRAELQRMTGTRDGDLKLPVLLSGDLFARVQAGLQLEGRAPTNPAFPGDERGAHVAL